MIYRVKKGKHDGKPNRIGQFLPIWGDFYKLLSVNLNHYYYPSQYPCGRSWNKLFGVGKFLCVNNKSAVLIAWAPQETPGYEFSIYLNDSKGGWDTFGTVSGDWCEAVFQRSGRKWLRVSLSSESGTVSHEFKMPGILRERGLWHGGQCPSEFDYTVEMDIK